MNQTINYTWYNAHLSTITIHFHRWAEGTFLLLYTLNIFLARGKITNAKTNKQEYIFSSHFVLAQYKFILTLRSASFVSQK